MLNRNELKMGGKAAAVSGATSKEKGEPTMRKRDIKMNEKLLEQIEKEKLMGVNDFLNQRELKL